MTNFEQKRKQEMHDSISFGVKAFVFGTALIIVCAVSGTPVATDGDALMASSQVNVAPQVVALARTPASAVAATSPSVRIEVPFKANAGDVEPLPPQF